MLKGDFDRQKNVKPNMKTRHIMGLPGIFWYLHSSHL